MRVSPSNLPQPRRSVRRMNNGGQHLMSKRHPEGVPVDGGMPHEGDRARKALEGYFHTGGESSKTAIFARQDRPGVCYNCQEVGHKAFKSTKASTVREVRRGSLPPRRLPEEGSEVCPVRRITQVVQQAELDRAAGQHRLGAAALPSRPRSTQPHLHARPSPSGRRIASHPKSSATVSNDQSRPARLCDIGRRPQ